MPVHREFSDALYAQSARIGHALASPKRLELLDLLSHGEKAVEVLAEHTGTPLKNTSAHLRVLREARLVDTRRDGTYMYYRLATDDIFRVVRALEALGHDRLAHEQQKLLAYLARRDQIEPVSFKDFRRLTRDGSVSVLDVRSTDEFEAGHIPGATSMPAPELKRRLREIPPNREVIVYSRERYSAHAFEAVTVLRKHGYRARRLEGGLADWKAERLPVKPGPYSVIP